MIPYRLTPEEEQWAREVARQRVATAKGDPRFAYLKPEDAQRMHTLGCMGELAGSRILKVEWPAFVSTYRTMPDVPPFWEVRYSTNPRRVKVATDDPPHYFVMHVTGRPPNLEVVGFIIAGWVQKNIPLTDPNNAGRPAHFLSAERLSPIDPGFHANCAWGHWPKTNSPDWICVFCGQPWQS